MKTSLAERLDAVEGTLTQEAAAREERAKTRAFWQRLRAIADRNGSIG